MQVDTWIFYFTFVSRIEEKKRKIIRSYFLESSRDYYISYYVQVDTRRRAISVRNKVMCNSLVICNTRPPSPRSLEINSCNTIRSYRETSSCLARAGAEFSHETFEKKEEKKCSCATFGSFIPHFSKLDTSCYAYGSFQMKKWIYDGGNWFDVR